jgi:hypothetical protein
MGSCCEYNDPAVALPPAGRNRDLKWSAERRAQRRTTGTHMAQEPASLSGLAFVGWTAGRGEPGKAA